MNEPRAGMDDDQLRSLLETVERIRAERFPHLDGTVVAQLLRLHADAGAGDGDLARAVEQAVDDMLSRGG